MTGIAERLGNVLFCLGALSGMAVMAVAMFNDVPQPDRLVIAGFGAGLFVAGGTLRYILAGRFWPHWLDG